MRIAILPPTLAVALSNQAAAMPRYVGVELVKSDPQGSGPILAALTWLQGTLLGNAATAVAMIAVAMVGFMMLTGRVNWKLGAPVDPGLLHSFRLGRHRHRHPVCRRDGPMRG